MSDSQATQPSLEIRDQAVAEAVRRRILARGREYIANLRVGGESTSSVEGFLMVLEVEAVGFTMEPSPDSQLG